MSHTNVTHRPLPMPRHSGLLCRKGIFQLNIRVPKDLRPLYGKREFFRHSLGTSDYSEAVSKVRFEAFRLDAEFAAKRREMANAKRASAPPPVLSDVSEREAHDIVLRFFVGLEKISEDWSEKDFSEFDEVDREESLDALRADEVVFSGGIKHYQANDGSEDLANFLKQEGIEIPSGSPAFQKLCPLFRKARLESTRRTMDRVENKTVRAREPFFREAFAHSLIEPERIAITLGELLRRYDKMLVDTNRADVTRRTYKIPSRILREVFGERTPLCAITRDKISELFGLLRRAPTNATKRFRGLTLQEAIAAADKRGEENRLSQKTLENYFVNISAIFNFAVEEELMAASPVKGRSIRAMIQGGEKRTRKKKFTDDELSRLFHAPLYTGCEDDETGFATHGKNKPRRARFWIPLLGLFHGFRSNEAAQLYTEDVADIDGIAVFKIRTTRESGDGSDKRLKTQQSERTVPVHPELIRIGFLEFVAERRRDRSEPRLFPNNPRGADGYYSTPFGRWFARFKRTTLGKDCKATFHTFRHHFRDAMRDAEISIEYAEALGGWGSDGRSEEKHYGTGASLQKLREQIEKVKYPALDLTHLYPVKPVFRVRRKVRD